MAQFLVCVCLLLIQTVLANVDKTTLQAGDCLCSTTDLHLRSSPGTSAPVVETLGANDCGPAYGGVLTKDGYTWFELKHNGKRVWGAGKFLTKKSKSACSGGSVGSGCSFIPRSQWGARSPRHSSGYLSHPVPYVFIHHTEGAPCSSLSSCYTQMRAVQNLHMDYRKWSDIGYSFLVGGDGNVYEGRGWDRVGAHTRGYNSVGIAVSFLGNFMHHNPPSNQINAAKRIINCGVSKGKVSSSYILKGHRDVNDTDCPGDSLYSLIHGWKNYCKSCQSGR